jgi:HAD superfamily hydrolase (TIGR01509 family)
MFKKMKNVELDEKDFQALIGTLDQYTVKNYFKKYHIRGNAIEWRDKKKKVYRKLLWQKVKMFPGVKQAMTKLSKKYKIAIATSSWREEARITIKKFKLQKYITKIIGKEDIRNHKPHPQIYQRMAKKLGVNEQECVVFEDSIPGVLAAKRAKCKCIAITNSHPASKLKKADLIVKSLKDKKVLKFIQKN